MTDAPLPPDAADELASAYLDGEATAAERARVETDPGLLARVDALARAQAAVGASVPVDPAARDAAISTALAAATEPGGVLASEATEPERAPVVPLARPRGAAPSTRWRYLAVAAAIAVAALAVPLLSQLGESDEQDTAGVALDDDAETFGDGEGLDAAEREEADTLAEDTAAGSAGGATEPASAAGELGAFEDMDGLAAAAAERVESALAPTTTVAGTGAEAMTSTTLAGPCAGALELPADAEVLLDATATLAGEPVVVVVHRSPGGDPQLLVAALEGCQPVIDRAL
jgi:hypothetical protein